MTSEARKTSETDIKLSLNLRGTGKYNFDTEIPFFDHMLSHISKHGQIDMDVWLRGDIGIDCHHSVEDTAILLGSTLHKQLGTKLASIAMDILRFQWMKF